MFTTRVESRDYAIKPMNCPRATCSVHQGLKTTASGPLRLPSSAPATVTSLGSAARSDARIRALPRTRRIIFCHRMSRSSRAADFIQTDPAWCTKIRLSTTSSLKALHPPDDRMGDDADWDAGRAGVWKLRSTKSRPEMDLLAGRGRHSMVRRSNFFPERLVLAGMHAVLYSWISCCRASGRANMWQKMGATQRLRHVACRAILVL